jgi:hypothetical protein
MVWRSYCWLEYATERKLVLAEFTKLRLVLQILWTYKRVGVEYPQMPEMAVTLIGEEEIMSSADQNGEAQRKK